MSTSLYFANVGGYAINVGDISTVAPRYDMQNKVIGSRITFMSKATTIDIPNLTPTEFMDQLAGAVNLALPD